MFRKRSPLRSGKLAKRKRVLFFVKCGLLLLSVTSLVAGAVYLAHRPGVTIAQVEIIGANTVPENEIEGLTREILSGKYFFLIPRTNILLYPERAIEAGIIRTMLRIKKADVHWTELTGIKVIVEERSPHALWCGENRLEGAVPQCFFIDESGFIYALAPDFTDDVYFRHYGPLVKSNPLGQFFLEETGYRELSLFFSSLQDAGVTAAEFAVRDDADYEFYLEDGMQVLFARDQKLGVVLENLLAVLNSEEFKQQDKFSIEYIDLRFGNKVFYKMKNRRENE